MFNFLSFSNSNDIKDEKQKISSQHRYGCLGFGPPLWKCCNSVIIFRTDFVALILFGALLGSGK